MFSNFLTQRRRSKRSTLRKLAFGFERLGDRRVLAGITGVVYADTDGSGVQDNGEAGLEDRIVFIDGNSNGIVDANEAIARTDESGNFSFEVSTGGHIVRVFNAASSQQFTAPADGRQIVSLPNASDTGSASFGLQIIGDNSAPTSDPVVIPIGADTSFILPSGIGLVKKGSDSDGDQGLIAIPTSDASEGRITIEPSGRVFYSHLEGFTGDDTATYILHDGHSTSESITLTVQVGTEPGDPEGIEIEGEPVLENSPPDTVIGTLKVNDPGLIDIFTFSVVDDSRFRVENDLLILAADVVNFENAAQMEVLVRAVNNNNPEEVVEQLIAIQVADADDPVTAIHAPISTFISERATEHIVGNVRVDDEDDNAGQPHEVNVDDERFEVVDGQLRLVPGSTLAFPADDGLVLTLSVDDPSPTAGDVTALVTITIENENDQPTGISFDGELYEQSVGAIVGPITVLDPDPDDIYEFTIDDQRFVVADGNLKLADGVFVVHPETIVLNITANATESDDTVSTELTIPVMQNDFPWQNPQNNIDVDGDGNIDPRDVLIILNSLNSTGPGPLPAPFDGEFYLDVNGDGLLTPLDALIVINQLNDTSLPIDPEPPEESTPPEGEYFAGPSLNVIDDALDDEEEWTALEPEEFFV